METAINRPIFMVSLSHKVLIYNHVCVCVFSNYLHGFALVIIIIREN